MTKIEEFIPLLLPLEGGFVDHPKDPGGATNIGVTLTTFRSFYGQNKTVADLKNITDEQIAHIYKVGYWDKMRADEINNQSLANIMVDWLVNSGTGKAKNIQRVLGVTVDGIVGGRTIAAINEANPSDLFDSIKQAREAFYRNLVARKPELKVFLKGWLNRLNAYTFAP